MRLLHRNENKQLLTECIEELHTIRTKSDILAICAKPTEYSWLGVQIATMSLFPKNTFQVPQYYSQSKFSFSELSKICKEIKNLQFNQVILSGFAPFYAHFVELLHNHTTIKVIYHGFLAELSENQIQQNSFKIIIELAQNKKIKALGFVKKGFAFTINKLFSIPTFEIILPNSNIIYQTKELPSSINVGCLVNTSFRKNIHNQVVAAMLIPNTQIHVFKTNELFYLPQNRIQYYDIMPHEKFVETLGKMTLNLHVTFSESWGQVLSESISQGIPCLSAYTSSFFDYDEDLKQKLVVSGFEDSWQIFQNIENVLSDYSKISQMCIDYAQKLNSLSNDRLTHFLND